MADMDQKTGLAISIQQPWAWLIVNGFKDVENREWSTKVRGWIGIHASKKFDKHGYVWMETAFPSIARRMPEPHLFEYGGIIGRVRIIDCVKDYGSPWFFGTYGFVLDNAQPLPFQSCRGKLSFFRPDLNDHAR